MNGFRVSIVWRFASCLAATFAFFAAPVAAQNVRHVDLPPGTTSLVTLSQNWADNESNDFYNKAQGSRLVPYQWFLHLEQPESTKSFRDATHIRSLGYIPRTPDAKNPDGLPIGFIKDAPYDANTPGLGLTCAACHTNLIRHQGKAYLVDGAPTLGDFEKLMRRLSESLQKTADDNAKFDRFAAAVLGGSATPAQKAALRGRLRAVAAARAEYNDRNLPAGGAAHFGPGRVDAFGAIYNEVAVTFLGIPGNPHPANAPVSYPCLWDTPQHDRVQWNGAAENKKVPFGDVFFGTNDVGALGRNAGEVLGVFGDVDIPSEFLLPRPYPSTVNKQNLIDIENSLKRLWSPEWPAAFGAIDPNLKAAGKVLYDQHCKSCHAPIDRKSPDRKVKAVLDSADTDPTMLSNFGRTGQTGKLRRRQISLLGLKRFGQTEAIAVILKHVVERSILKSDMQPEQVSAEVTRVLTNGIPDLDADSLNPGFRMTASVKLGENRYAYGQFDSLSQLGRDVKIKGASFQIFDRRIDSPLERVNGAKFDLRTQAGLSAAAERFGARFVVEDVNDHLEASASVTLHDAEMKIGYKARPLNGIWATAPYLHNGSVPSLAELLKPAAARKPQFHVGGAEFDPANVGFVDDPSQPIFDTTLPGNSNKGHEYGANLTDTQRRELLEYLKSL